MLITSVWFPGTSAGYRAPARLRSPPVARVFSGIQPSGELTLGTYLGCPAALRGRPGRHHLGLLHRRPPRHHGAPGPGRAAPAHPRHGGALPGQRHRPRAVSTLFVQSHVAEHAELAWLMECTASFGELSRMTQFKEKSDRQQFVSAGLFTYPALMAADILLYDTDRVPVGDDQRQHLELTRDVAERFNSRYGDDLRRARGRHPQGRRPGHGPAGARPARCRSRSTRPQGTVLMLDEPAVIERKFKRAVTDNDGEVRYDPRDQARRVEPAVDPRRRPPARDPAALADALHAVRPAQGRRGRGGRSSCCARSRPATPSCAADPARLDALLARAPTRPEPSPAPPSPAPSAPSACAEPRRRTSGPRRSAVRRPAHSRRQERSDARSEHRVSRRRRP